MKSYIFLHLLKIEFLKAEGKSAEAGQGRGAHYQPVGRELKLQIKCYSHLGILKRKIPPVTAAAKGLPGSVGEGWHGGGTQPRCLSASFHGGGWAAPHPGSGPFPLGGYFP